MKALHIPDPAIEISGLTKRYPEVTAVDALDLQVRRGEIYGFLGRNGAGKTTTIRMLLGLIHPDEGAVRIFGKHVESDRAGAVGRVGSLVETATAYPNLTTYENLDLQRRLLGSDQAEIDHVMTLLGLQEYRERCAGKLSLGNRQRLALARALLGKPRILVLDEPANALDPAGIVEVRTLLRSLADREGMTIFVSSHILGEISLMADRIGIIHQGRLIEEFSPSERLAAERPIAYRVLSTDSTRAMRLLEGVRGVETVEKEGPSGWIRAIGPEIDPALMSRALVQDGVGLMALIPITESLETHFLRITGGEV